MLAGEERVRAVRGGERVVRGQCVRRSHGRRVDRHRGALLMGHRLCEHQVRVGVDCTTVVPRVETIEERVHLAGVGITESRGSDRLLLGTGRRDWIILGH